MAEGLPAYLLVVIVVAMIILGVSLFFGKNIMDWITNGPTSDYNSAKQNCCISFSTVARLCDSQGDAVTNYECSVGKQKMTIAELVKKVGGQGTIDGVKKACGCLSTLTTEAQVANP